MPLIWSFAHSLPLQLAPVVLVPGVLALVFGWLAFRSRVTGVYLSILTQAMTLAVSLYLFQNDSGLRGNTLLSGLQNLPGLANAAQESLSIGGRCGWACRLSRCPCLRPKASAGCLTGSKACAARTARVATLAPTTVR